ncbi:hypothetical protein V5799_021521 [Amblyomma americanum]|uniref:Flavin-containing monooxygenase n=1 Tax=Amblyomma americanum TaxID=6943 RepID=A0AAQ4FN73_AMBAM
MDVYVLNQTRLWLYSWLPQSCSSRFVVRVAYGIWDHEALGLVADHGVMTQAIVANQYIDGKIIDGAVKIRGPPQTFTENGLVMDNVEEEVVAVIFATGFSTGLPFPTDAVPRDGERLLL